MKKILSLSVLALFALSIFTVGQSVNAQDSGNVGGSGFRLSPTRVDMTIERGSTDTATVLVRNISQEKKTARAVVDDFSANDSETGSPQLLIGDLEVDNYPYSIKPFVLAINDIELDPGEEKEVLATVSIPEDTAPGSYFGLLRFTAVEDTADIEGESPVNLTASVGTIFLIDVPGETVDLLNLEDITVTKGGSAGSLFSSAPDTVAIRLSNSGNTFQAPFGKVLVKDWSGNVVHEYEFNVVSGEAPRGNVLPETTRRFENELQNIGSFGRYKIEANISYGDGGNLITATTTFWVIPWVTIGIVLIVILTLGFAGTKGLKMYNNKVVSRSKGTRVKRK